MRSRETAGAWRTTALAADVPGRADKLRASRYQSAGPPTRRPAKRVQRPGVSRKRLGFPHIMSTLGFRPTHGGEKASSGPGERGGGVNPRQLWSISDFLGLTWRGNAAIRRAAAWGRRLASPPAVVESWPFGPTWRGNAETLRPPVEVGGRRPRRLWLFLDFRPDLAPPVRVHPAGPRVHAASRPCRAVVDLDFRDGQHLAGRPPRCLRRRGSHGQSRHYPPFRCGQESRPDPRPRWRQSQPFSHPNGVPMRYFPAI